MVPVLEGYSKSRTKNLPALSKVYQNMKLKGRIPEYTKHEVEGAGMIQIELLRGLAKLGTQVIVSPRERLVEVIPSKVI